MYFAVKFNRKGRKDSRKGRKEKVSLLPFCSISSCILLCAVTAFAWAEPYFEALDNETNSIVGTLVALDQTQVVVDVLGERQTIPLEKLVKIRNLAPSPYRTPSSDAQNAKTFPGDVLPGNVLPLELKDGSQLTLSSFSLANNVATCWLLEHPNEVSLPLDTLSAIRFAVRNLHDVINAPEDWVRLAVPHAEGDRLIVGQPGAFDVYTGILHEINAETIFFNVDGEVLPVPRRRVFGLVLHPVPSASVSPLATLKLWTGTRGMIADLKLNGSELTWQTSTGLTVASPLSMVDEIDFGEKGVACLFDFERVRSEFALPIASDIEFEQLNYLRKFYESRSSVPRCVVLDGTAYDRGMTLFGKAMLEYRLPKPFASLKAVIGIEDQFRPHALATLQILADSQVLGTWELRGDSVSQPIHLNLPQNCRLITISAEPLPHSNVPAVLTIAGAKLFE